MYDWAQLCEESGREKNISKGQLFSKLWAKETLGWNQVASYLGDID